MAMPKPLRIALLWMLMLALPAQGMAAMAMQLCALASGSGEIQAPAAHHPGAHATGQHAQVSIHAEHDAGAASDTAQQTDNRLCSLCAFCVGAVALTSLAISHSPLQVDEPSLARLERFVGFVADIPRRPPRLLLA